MDSSSGSGSNTILWIIILILVTFLLQDDDGDPSAAVEEEDPPVVVATGPLNRHKETLTVLCDESIAGPIEDLRRADPDSANAAQLATAIQTRLRQHSPRLAEVLAERFVEGNPVGINLEAYDAAIYMARRNYDTRHGVSRNLYSRIGDCGTSLP
jgi:hypothetical protein